MIKRSLLPLTCALSLLVSAGASAQSPMPALDASKFGTMFFNTNVGSFKILGPGDDKAEGTVTLNCHGSVLISGLEGNVVANGMRREISRTDLQKQVYFGQGTLTVRGKFKAIQFFGRDLQGTWNGFGIIRLYGEFDKDLNTGDFWYAGSPAKRPWGNGGMTVTNPESKPRGPGRPGRVRDENRPRVQDK